MVEPNSRILMDITKDENSKLTTKFHYENLKTSFHGFYTRNRDVLFVIVFLLLVIGLHMYRHAIVDLFHRFRNKRYRVKNDLPNLFKCKKCKVCDESMEEYLYNQHPYDDHCHRRGHDLSRTTSFGSHRPATPNMRMNPRVTNYLTDELWGPEITTEPYVE